MLIVVHLLKQEPLQAVKQLTSKLQNRKRGKIMFKKLLSMTLAAIMVMGMSATALAAETPTNNYILW